MSVDAKVTTAVVTALVDMAPKPADAQVIDAKPMPHVFAPESVYEDDVRKAAGGGSEARGPRSITEPESQEAGKCAQDAHKRNAPDALRSNSRYRKKWSRSFTAYSPT